MKPNTIIDLSDGRMATVVYHGLDGYGVKFGEHTFPVEDLPEMDAMLRSAWREDHEYEMVGPDFTIIREGAY